MSVFIMKTEVQKQIMKRLYYKNQILIIILVTTGVIFTVYQLAEYKKALSFRDVFILKVIKQNCHAAPGMSSAVWVKNNGKEYSIALPCNECIHYPVGSSVKAFYHKDNDRFIFRTGDTKFSKNMILLSLILIISLIPWKIYLKK